MKELILVRGLPGSGKTSWSEDNYPADYYETDMYWLRPDGEYDFNVTLLRQAHEWCRNICELCMKDEFISVVVSNTFSQLWEMQPYLDMAEEYGYEVEVRKMMGDYGSIHDVPQKTIDKMKERWEDYPGEIETWSEVPS